MMKIERTMNGLMETAVSFTLLLLGAAGCIPPGTAHRAAKAQTTRPAEQSLRVRFFVLKANSKIRGPGVGTAELSQGKLTLAVTDERLRMILEKPYPRRGYDQNGILTFLSDPPGSYRHLQAISIECSSFGYTCEVY